MKHIVFILGSYHPSYSAVGRCIGNLTDEMAKKYKVTVICEKNNFDDTDIEDYNNQTIIRVVTPYIQKRLLILKKAKNATPLGVKYYKLRQIIHRVKGVMSAIISKDISKPALSTAYFQALNNITTPIDLIIPTCLPFDSVIVALNYKKNNKHVKVIPFLFDLFAANKNIHRFKFNLKLKFYNNLQLERRMLKESVKVFHVHNWSAHFSNYHSMYLEKTIEIEHPLLIDNTNKENQNKSDNINLTYSGVVDVGNRNPEFTLSILTKLVESKRNIVVDFYSFGNAEFIIKKYSNLYKNNIISHGKISSDAVKIKQRRANFLLSIGNKDISQAPSKIIEYIACGKPIIHVCKNRKDPSISLLTNYPVKLIIYESGIVPMEELLNFIDLNKNVNISFETIEKYYSHAIPAKIVNKLIEESNI